MKCLFDSVRFGSAKQSVPVPRSPWSAKNIKSVCFAICFVSVYLMKCLFDSVRFGSLKQSVPRSPWSAKILFRSWIYYSEHVQCLWRQCSLDRTRPTVDGCNKRVNSCYSHLAATREWTLATATSLRLTQILHHCHDCHSSYHGVLLELFRVANPL